MTLPTSQSPTHAPPRITLARFKELLKSKNSPALPEAEAVYNELVSEGVDPSFALAQFRVESQYGTDGWAEETGSWGNMLYDAGLTLLSGPKKTFETSSGHTYTFATYTSYHDAIKDYIRYIHWYRDRHGLETIYEATGRWLGLSRTGDKGHLTYVSTIVSDMIEYETREGEFYETGDKMIFAKGYVDSVNGRIAKRIRVNKGTMLYRGTDGVEFRPLAPAGDYLDLLCTGPVQGSTLWAQVCVKTLAEGQLLLYVKNPAWSTVKDA